MNLKLWFEKMFDDNKTDEGLVNVRTSGRNDGLAMTNAYADGFLEGVGEVLHTRLNGFHRVIETSATPLQNVKKIGSKRT